jgi:hypothetical protein
LLVHDEGLLPAAGSWLLAGGGAYSKSTCAAI